MREILFRGKCKYNGKWIEGCLVKLGRESFSDPERYGICNKAVPLGESGVCYNLKIDEIVPETVGQYTGLTDKNGEKIFEGDVIKCISRFDAKDMVVIFEKAEFHLVDCQRYKNYTECCGYRYFGTLETEVIGNIHDNSELLKGSEW